MPFGDSITFGIGFAGGYRVELFNKAVTAKQDITFLGSQSNGPAMVAGKAFPPKNEGHSGWTIDPSGACPSNLSSGITGISCLIPTPAFTTIPDIVLLMIGTNDAGSLTAQKMTDNLAKLLDTIISTAPNALLVVGKLTPLSSQQAKVDTYNGNIPGLVSTRAAAGKHILLADHSNLMSTDIGDGVHPNQGGYTKMAENWYSVIKTYLPTAP